MKKYFPLMVLTCLFLYGSSFAYATQNVHIVVIDGARYGETFGDTTHQYIPAIWNKLRPLGTIYTRYYNDSITSTTPGHASIISGVWQNIQNDGTERATSPTLFEYFRKERHAAASENYVILGKYKLNSLSSSTHAEYGPAYGASVIYSANPIDDILTWQNFDSILTTHHPRLTITNLAQVDGWGHNGVWEEYLRSIRLADSIVNEMWNLIQSDMFYRDKTTLIVTNDHGRHLDDFTGHVDGCDGCRHIMLMIVGPDTKAGLVDSTRRTQIDIAPTVGELMDFSTPYCAGTSIIPVRPPATPVPISPANDALYQPLDLSLLWSPVTRAVHYHVQLSTSPSFDRKIVNDSLLTWNSQGIGPLTIKTTYYWRVRSVNSGGPGGWSETRNFHTIPTAPPEVAPAAPENSATISTDSVTLAWTTSSTEADRYFLQIASDSLMNHTVFFDSTITALSKVQKCYRNRAIFWWRVKAHYIAGWGEWSQVRRYIVDIPVILAPPERFSFDFRGGQKAGTPLVVRYTLPVASPVSIKLYTMTGQLIKTIFNGPQLPDFYHIAIPAMPLAPGYNVIVFIAGPYQKTTPFILY
jgi:hypothetical protein